MANMFGALNRFMARLDSDPNVTGASSSSSQANGFQVLRNNDTGIALEPWFDFIIGLNGHNIDNPDPNLFLTELQNCANSTISLGVYGARGQQIREVYLDVPGRGTPLGLALQWSPLRTAEDVWHILDVIPNSPADVAGLLPYSDYVIGSPERVLRHGDAGLGELIDEFIDRPLRLFVYNQEYDVTRLVTITPARHWGGDGALGCVLGYGALHRIPAPLTEPAQGPGETLFETSRPSQDFTPAAAGVGAPPADTAAGSDFLVPANMPLAQTGTSPPPPSAGPPTGGKPRKQRAHHQHQASPGLDDYFAEGEQKSREIDGAPKSSSGGLPPPPPKAGGPPKSATPGAESEA